MRSTRLQPVDEPDETFPAGSPSAVEVPRQISVPEKQVMDLLIKGFGQRALTILSMLFTLALAGSAFWAWMTVLPQPTTPQLVGVGGYAGFCLLLEFVRRR